MAENNILMYRKGDPKDYTSYSIEAYSNKNGTLTDILVDVYGIVSQFVYEQVVYWAITHAYKVVDQGFMGYMVRDEWLLWNTGKGSMPKEFTQFELLGRVADGETISMYTLDQAGLNRYNISFTYNAKEFSELRKLPFSSKGNRRKALSLNPINYAALPIDNDNGVYSINTFIYISNANAEKYVVATAGTLNFKTVHPFVLDYYKAVCTNLAAAHPDAPLVVGTIVRLMERLNADCIQMVLNKYPSWGFNINDFVLSQGPAPHQLESLLAPSLDDLVAIRDRLWSAIQSLNIYKDVIANPNATPQDIYNLLKNFGKEALQQIPIPAILTMLQILSKGEIERYKERIEVSGMGVSISFPSENSEELVVNIVDSIIGRPDIEKTEFLIGLLEEKRYGREGRTDKISLYEYLYVQILDSGFDLTNVKNFCNNLYKVWVDSYFNPYKNLPPNSTVQTESELENPNFVSRYNHYNDDPATTKLPNQSGGSGYSITYQKIPPFIPYESHKRASYYFDNFDFHFHYNENVNEFEILCVEDPVKRHSLPSTPDDILKYVKEVIPRSVLLKFAGDYDERRDGVGEEIQQRPFLGSFGIFEGVTIACIPSDSDDFVVKMPVVAVNKVPLTLQVNNANPPVQKIVQPIPLFYLKFIDDAGDASDVFTTVGYVADVASIFIPLGQISKLRHLRRLSTAVKAVETLNVVNKFNVLLKLRIALSWIELTGGTISFFVKFAANGCTGYTNPQAVRLCEAIRNIGMILEFASLGGELGLGIAKRLNKNWKAASDILNSNPTIFDNESVVVNGETVHFVDGTKQKILGLAIDHQNAVSAFKTALGQKYGNKFDDLIANFDQWFNEQSMQVAFMEVFGEITAGTKDLRNTVGKILKKLNEDAQWRDAWRIAYKNIDYSTHGIAKVIVTAQDYDAIAQLAMNLKNQNSVFRQLLSEKAIFWQGYEKMNGNLRSYQNLLDDIGPEWTNNDLFAFANELDAIYNSLDDATKYLLLGDKLDRKFKTLVTNTGGMQSMRAIDQLDDILTEVENALPSGTVDDLVWIKEPLLEVVPPTSGNAASFYSKTQNLITSRPDLVGFRIDPATNAIQEVFFIDVKLNMATRLSDNQFKLINLNQITVKAIDVDKVVHAPIGFNATTILKKTFTNKKDYWWKLCDDLDGEEFTNWGKINPKTGI